MIEGSRLLQEMMENFQDPESQARQIKDVEHIGDSITHEIAKSSIKPLLRRLTGKIFMRWRARWMTSWI